MYVVLYLVPLDKCLMLQVLSCVLLNVSNTCFLHVQQFIRYSIVLTIMNGIFKWYALH